MPLDQTTQNRLAALGGLISHEVGMRLAELAAAVPPEACIVEVGSYRGKSGCYLGAGSRAGLGAPVFCIDPWDLPGNPNGRFGFNQRETRERFQQQVNASGLQQIVTGLRAYSRDAAMMWTRPIGLLYIDGSHTEADVRTDVLAWSPHRLPGAPMAFDDYDTKNNPGVKRFVDTLRAKGGRWEFGPAPLMVGWP